VFDPFSDFLGGILMNQWKLIAYSTVVSSFCVFIAAAGVYCWKTSRGIDLLKDRHLLILKQEPKPEKSYEPPKSGWRSAQQQNEGLTRGSL
jgi:hypothetical protein